MAFPPSLPMTDHPSPPQRSRQVIGLTLLLYWILVMGAWGLFAGDRGLTFETHLITPCLSDVKACLMYVDELRPYNSLFMGLAYLLGDGSYFSFQIMYGLLWWGKGAVLFLLFYRIWPGHPLFAVLVGAVAIAHVSDGALNWVGQLHQLGFIFLGVLSVYFLIEGYLSTSRPGAIAYTLAALLALYVSLWTYESHFFILLVVPVILYAVRPKRDRRFWLITAVWYVLPAIYASLQLHRTLTRSFNAYQKTVLRSDLTPLAIAQDWLIHIGQSLQFWQWGSNSPVIGVGMFAPVVAGLCMVAFAVGLYLLWRTPTATLHLPKVQPLWTTTRIGLLILILSFPVYVLLEGNVIFWRTQMLSSVGAAIALVGAIALLTQLMPRKGRAIAAIGLSAVIIFYGIQASVRLQGFHESRWKLHQNVMQQVSQLVPDIEPQTLILLTNLPKAYEQDPFGLVMWFDVPLHLLYPGKQVMGYFVYETGEHPSDNGWTFTPEGFVHPTITVPYRHIIALEYRNGTLTLLPQFPTSAIPQAGNPTYAPETRIKQRLPSDRTIRLYAR
jgi:hypothetical protein